MTPLIQLKTDSSIISRCIPACLPLGFSPRAQAVITDPEDYFPGGNTACGGNSPFSISEMAVSTRQLVSYRSGEQHHRLLQHGQRCQCAR